MQNILTIQDKLKKINKTLYVVGGFCREQILRNKNTDGDIDLVTDATPEEMKQVLKIVGEVGKKYGTCIASQGGQSFEITTFRKDIGSINHRKPAEVEFTNSLEEDAKRRDFTLNAIYYNPKTKKYIDPENGINDIQNKIIRFVGNIENRIHEDALRILRFIRFKNKYNLKVADKNYWEILEKNTPLLKKLPIERIKQELDKILLNPNNAKALEDLKKIGVLKLFLPEIDCLDKYNGNKYHLEGNVWIHTKMCIQEMNKIIKTKEQTESPLLSKEGARGWSEKKAREWSNKKLLLLRTILLHDIGKGPTYSIGKNGETHYYNHDNIGAQMFLEQISPRLKFSKTFENEIYFIITEHLRTFSIPNMRKLKARKLMMHKYFEDLLLVLKADCYGKTPQNIESFNQITEIYNEFKEIIKTKKFFTGNDIKKKHPELEGRQIGERLKMINEQILVVDF